MPDPIPSQNISQNQTPQAYTQIIKEKPKGHKVFWTILTLFILIIFIGGGITSYFLLFSKEKNVETSPENEYTVPEGEEDNTSSEPSSIKISESEFDIKVNDGKIVRMENTTDSSAISVTTIIVYNSSDIKIYFQMLINNDLSIGDNFSKSWKTTYKDNTLNKDVVIDIGVSPISLEEEYDIISFSGSITEHEEKLCGKLSYKAKGEFKNGKTFEIDYTGKAIQLFVDGSYREGCQE